MQLLLGDLCRCFFLPCKLLSACCSFGGVANAVILNPSQTDPLPVNDMNQVTCPQCSENNGPEALFCHGCGTSLDFGVTQFDFKRILLGEWLKGNLFAFLLLALIWGVLNYVVPTGWGQATVNIAFSLLSVWFAVSFWQTLKMVLPGWFSFPISIVIWGLFIGILRPLFTDILSWIFG